MNTTLFMISSSYYNTGEEWIPQKQIRLSITYKISFNSTLLALDKMNLTTLANDGFNQVPLYQADVQDIVTTRVGRLSRLAVLAVIFSRLEKKNNILHNSCKKSKKFSIWNLIGSLKSSLISQKDVRKYEWYVFRES